MIDIKENEEELWKQIYFLWSRLNVPDINERKFEIGWYTKESPWFSLSENKQEQFETKSIGLTAQYLLNAKSKGPETLAAFKLYAFLKNFYEFTPIKTLLADILYRADLDPYFLWYSATRTVLPYLQYDCIIEPFEYEKEIEKGDWIKTTLTAAKIWIAVSNQWEIIILPKFTPEDSELNKEFDKFSQRYLEDKDFQRYVQLRLRYEKR